MTKVIISMLLAVAMLSPSRLHAAAAGDASLREPQKALAAGDWKKAFSGYSQAALGRKDPLAQFTLALFYLNGWGRPADPAVACHWLGKAARAAIPAAAHFYAECLQKGVSQPPDPSGAAAWYEKGAELGYFPSLCALGKLYLTGEGVPKDPAKGVALCQQAADRDIPSAQTQLGLFYLEGDPSIRSFDGAYQWFLAAAQKNDAVAYHYLGLMERDGLGRQKAAEKARYWFESAASKGYLPSYYPTACLYYHAPVDPETDKLPADDLARAYLWLSATVKRSADAEERRKSSEMLENVLKIMPKSWIPTLDEKLSQHLAAFPMVPPAR
jgi:uncharacterized protein